LLLLLLLLAFQSLSQSGCDERSESRRGCDERRVSEE
jgi:hypothetical protein